MKTKSIAGSRERQGDEPGGCVTGDVAGPSRARLRYSSDIGQRDGWGGILEGGEGGGRAGRALVTPADRPLSVSYQGLNEKSGMYSTCCQQSDENGTYSPEA